VARNRAINLIARDGLTENRAAAPRIELPSLIAATMRSRKSRDSGAGMTSPRTPQNRLPGTSIPDLAQHKSAHSVVRSDEACRFNSVAGKTTASEDTMMMMARTGPAAVPFDHASTLVVAVEISDRSWVLGAHVSGSTRSCSRLVIEPAFEQLVAALAHLTRRAALIPARTVVVYEAGHTGFWLARLLRAQGMEAHVLHPASAPVDRRAHRAKTDRLDVDLLVRAVLAWLRGNPASARWQRSPTRRTRISGGPYANARNC
jgi:hypothetical protein